MDNICSEPTVYILMRSDLDSLNPGKAMAQAAHAGQMAQTAINNMDEDIQFEFNGDRGFARTLVLSAFDDVHIMTIIDEANKNNMDCSLVLDPTYPVQDGCVIHLVSIVTCAWIIVHKGDVLPSGMNILELYP